MYGKSRFYNVFTQVISMDNSILVSNIKHAICVTICSMVIILLYTGINLRSTDFISSYAYGHVVNLLYKHFKLYFLY